MLCSACGTSTLCGWATYFMDGHLGAFRAYNMAFTHMQAAHLLAAAFIAAPAGAGALVASARKVVQAEDALFTALSEVVLRQFGARLPYMAQAAVADFIWAQDVFHDAFDSALFDRQTLGLELASALGQSDVEPIPSSTFTPPTRNSFLAPASVKQPVFGTIPAYDLPRIDAVADLCTLLEIHPQRLEKFTTRWRASATQLPAMDDYVCYWRGKKSGGARLIAQPKSDLKAVLRLLLQRLLNKVAPHQAAHGFRRGHSIATHAKLHAGQALILRCDLQDFFTSIQASRIHGMFRHLGYAEPIAQALTRLCTMRVTGRTARRSTRR